MKKKQTKFITVRGDAKSVVDKLRMTTVDMYNEDRKACEKSDKALAKAGVEKKKKDIFADDVCHGCKFALERQDCEGPFDRRYCCVNVKRIEDIIRYALNKCLEAKSLDISTLTWVYRERENKKNRRTFLEVNEALLAASNLITELAKDNFLPCSEESTKPMCYVNRRT